MARAGGFTLIEVVMATLVGAGALAALLQIFGDGAVVAERATDRRIAVLVARSALDGAGADGPLFDGAGWGGADQGLVWGVTVSEWAPGTPDGAVPPLVRIIAQVARPGGPVLARLETLRLALPPPPVFDADAPAAPAGRR